MCADKSSQSLFFIPADNSNSLSVISEINFFTFGCDTLQLFPGQIFHYSIYGR